MSPTRLCIYSMVCFTRMCVSSLVCRIVCLPVDEPTRFETCRNHQKLNTYLENCTLRLFVLYNYITTHGTTNIKYLVFITTHTESILDVFCITSSIHTVNQMLTWRKNTAFVNAELSTAERGAVVGRYAENEVVRSTARWPALRRHSWNQVMQSGWHHRSLCAALSAGSVFTWTCCIRMYTAAIRKCI